MTFPFHYPIPPDWQDHYMEDINEQFLEAFKHVNSVGRDKKMVYSLCFLVDDSYYIFLALGLFKIANFQIISERTYTVRTDVHYTGDPDITPKSLFIHSLLKANPKTEEFKLWLLPRIKEYQEQHQGTFLPVVFLQVLNEE